MSRVGGLIICNCFVILLNLSLFYCLLMVKCGRVFRGEGVRINIEIFVVISIMLRVLRKF